MTQATSVFKADPFGTCSPRSFRPTNRQERTKPPRNIITRNGFEQVGGPKTIEMENLTARLAYHGKEAGPNGLAFFGATAMTNIKPGDLVVHNESGELLSVLNVLELPGLDSAALEPYLEIIFEGKYKVMKPAKEFTLRSAARLQTPPSGSGNPMGILRDAAVRGSI